MVTRLEIDEIHVLHIAVLVTRPLFEFNVPFIFVLLQPLLMLGYFIQNSDKFLALFIFVSLKCFGKLLKAYLANMKLFHF